MDFDPQDPKSAYLVEMLSKGLLDNVKSGTMAPNTPLQYAVPGLKTYSAKVGALGGTPIPKLNPDMDQMLYHQGLDTQKDLPPEAKAYTQNHELHHILDNRGGYHGHHPMFDIVGDIPAIKWGNQLRQHIKNNQKKIIDTFPATAYSGYIEDPSKGDLSELMAELGAIEQTYNVDVTNHPLFKDLFKDPLFKEAFRSTTGFRKTRMDARDPSPNKPTQTPNLLERLYGVLK